MMKTNKTIAVGETPRNHLIIWWIISTDYLNKIAWKINFYLNNISVKKLKFSSESLKIIGLYKLWVNTSVKSKDL